MTVTKKSISSLVVRAVLLLVAAISIAISPAPADLLLSQQPLISPITSAANPGTANAGWSLSPLVATPASLESDRAGDVTTIAQAGPPLTARDPVRSGENGIHFTTQANGLATVVFNRTNYNYTYGEGLLSYVTMRTPAGSIISITPNQCSGTFSNTTVIKTCYAGSDQLSVSVTYSIPSDGILEADIQLTNLSAVNTVADAIVSTLGIHTSQSDPSNSRIADINAQNPLSYVSFVNGRVAVWANTPGVNFSVNMICGGSYICKNQAALTNIAPGQTMSGSYSIAFSMNTAQSSYAWVPQAYRAFAQAYPHTVNWPDRRPVMSWFISDHGHQSATNPRGYLFNPAINASNIPAFKSLVISQAKSILSSMQSRPVQPQGIVIWDIEGQEFVQPTTYIGDPRVLSQGYAPEMDAAADQVFALFKNAGYKVGVTLRPGALQWGSAASLPSTCNFNSNNNYKDYYIEVDRPFQQKFYACNAPDKWSLIPAGNGGQTIYRRMQVRQVIDLLLSKVAYARSRWGTTIYYVDSAVWDGGATMTADIFRALQSAYPDSLFLPEESYIGSMGVSVPYAAPNGALNAQFAPLSWRYAYPTGAIVENLSNCTGSCWTKDASNFGIGQKIGDIAMYSVPQQLSSAQLGAIENMIVQARKQAGSITVTDQFTGAEYKYSGSPATVYKYPVKMRVYFASSATNLRSSTIYCESGGWLGENSCTLNLTGLTSAQVRYYDFEDNLVVTEPERGL